MIKVSRECERRASDILQGEFNPKNSRVLAVLEKLTPDASLDRLSLVALTKVIGAVIGVKMPRNFTRRRSLILKWLDMHLILWEPLAHTIVLEISQKLMRPRQKKMKPEILENEEEWDIFGRTSQQESVE
jgi:hypothetical protein